MTTTSTTVLVAYASKMGGTREIATEIAAVLAAAGLDARVRDAAQVTDLDGYDAVVLGSAIYTSRWRPDALAVLRLLADRAEQLQQVPSWLFQSGPCGDQADAAVPTPKKVAKYVRRIGTAPPVTFGGRLDLATATGFIARKMADGPLAGDYRDFDQVRRFAESIAQRLTAPKPAEVWR
jgi:menaquinone-dependent protoporphyrinogen oxidase